MQLVLGLLSPTHSMRPCANLMQRGQPVPPCGNSLSEKLMQPRGARTHMQPSATAAVAAEVLMQLPPLENDRVHTLLDSTTLLGCVL